MTSRKSVGLRRSTPSWCSDKWQSDEQHVRKEPAGYNEWRRHDTQGNARETGGASVSADGAGSQGSGKKKETCASKWVTAKKISIKRGNCTKSMDDKKGESPQDMQKSDGGERQSLNLESGHREGIGYAGTSLRTVRASEQRPCRRGQDV